MPPTATASTATRRQNASESSLGDPRPANNNEAATAPVAPVPKYIVLAALAAEFERQAEALAISDLKALPPRFNEYLSWMEFIQARAWRDQRLLVRIDPDDDGHPITVDEIDTLGKRIEWVRTVLATDRASQGNAPDVTADIAARMSTPMLAASVDAKQRALHTALMYRFRKSPERRAVLRDAERAHTKTTRSARSALLLSHFSPEAMERWARSLPGAEGEALDTLRVLHPEWVQRVKADATADAAVSVGLPERAFNTLLPTFNRVLEAGRYLERAIPGHTGSYPGAPRNAGKRSKKVSTPVTPVTPPQG